MARLPDSFILIVYAGSSKRFVMVGMANVIRRKIGTAFVHPHYIVHRASRRLRLTPRYGLWSSERDVAKAWRQFAAGLKGHYREMPGEAVHTVGMLDWESDSYELGDGGSGIQFACIQYLPLDATWWFTSSLIGRRH